MSTTAARFVLWSLAWGLGVLGLFAFTGFASSGGLFPATAHLPYWTYLALVVGVFPGAVHVARSLTARPSSDSTAPAWDLLSAAVPVLVSATGLGLVVFTLAGWIAPHTLAASRPDLASVETRAMSLPQLQDQIEVLVGAARSTGEPEVWIRANQTIWEHDRRLAQSLLVPVLALLGLLVGVWAQRISWPGIRQMSLWCFGLFLLVSGYLAGENGYELVASRTIGGETPAGLFLLIVPGTILLVLGPVTVLHILGSSRRTELDMDADRT